MPEDKIFIRNLTIGMSVGIYEQEKQNKQRVIINITLDVESNANKKLTSINNVVSYESIINEVTALAKSKHYDLLEEFAEKIAEICTLKNKVVQARICIEKPDIINNTKSVGIEIIRP